MKREPMITIPRSYSGAVLAVLITLFLVGCAGGSAKQVSSRGDEPVPRPPVFLIYDFAVDPEDVIVDTAGLNFGG
jgi:hypothetical protein